MFNESSLATGASLIEFIVTSIVAVAARSPSETVKTKASVPLKSRLGRYVATEPTTVTFG